MTRRLVLVGPTASGKSALGLAVAQLLGDAEIVSVDSMQVYREMDIGTAKATAADRALVPHHLLDVLDPAEEASVAWFQGAAAAVLDDLAARGRRALLVGGTGLYHRAVVDGLDIPGQYPEIRDALGVELAGLTETHGEAGAAAILHRRLDELDPLAASRIDPGNARRIVRALEVCVGSGRPFSASGEGLTAYPATDDLVIGLRLERAALAERIEARVHQMMAAGFLDEVRRLADRPGGVSRTAAQALGYRELLDHLAGRCSLDDAVRTTVVRTRRFAVRQERWFRRDPRVEWIDAQSPPSPERIASTLDAS